MLELLKHLFAAVCGQNPEHTWAPGGVLLPCCQRCTGLYVGACAAFLLHGWLRPKLTGRFLEVHAAFLLLMAPFGFHWVAHGPVLRTLTGVLFGFAVVTFLWAPIDSRAPLMSSASPFGRLRCRPDGAYAIGLLVTLALLPLVAALGGSVAAYVLSSLAFCGATALGALLLANTGLALRGAARLVRRPTRESLAP